MMRWPLVFLGALSLGAPTTYAQSPVYFDIQTSTGSDTLYVGVPSHLRFNFDPTGNVVLGIVFPMQFTFQSVNLFGKLQDSAVTFTPEAVEIYELTHVANLFFGDGVGTDSLLVAFMDGGGDHWPDSAELWRLSVVPLATGCFHIDSITLPPHNVWSALDQNGDPLPFEILNYGREYCVVWLPGDVNSNGQVNAGDIVFMVQWVFKSGTAPPFCAGLGDVDCNGVCTSADIIQLINYSFKGGPAPCDISALIPGTWVCP